MFKFFQDKKTQSKDDESQHIASISYKIKTGGNVIIDMEIEDYNEESMSALFSIIDILSNDMCVIETIGALKDNLIKNNKSEWLEKLVHHTTKAMLKKTNVTKLYDDMINSQPCIKPSEMLK
jgi:hypothetical protein